MAERKVYLGPLTDSRRWDHLSLRPDDVIVATPPKSGTTLMQTIIALLLSGDPEIDPQLSLNAPWVDIRVREIAEVAARLEVMTARRSLKSHTPLDGLPVGAGGQFICVFRHPLDVHFSYRKHLRNMPMPFFGLWYPEDDPDGVTFRRFLDGGAEGFDTDAVPLALILQHYRAARDAAAVHGNVSLFHFADMTRDIAGTFDRVARILGVTHPPHVMADLQAVVAFDNMRAQASRYAPGGGTGFMKSDADFFDSGSHGKWEGALPAAELAAYDSLMAQGLPPQERAWLEFGERGQPD
ncbi:MAG: sulfotransferase domain-containing protein [Pseudomonadota bacterium]